MRAEELWATERKVARRQEKDEGSPALLLKIIDALKGEGGDGGGKWVRLGWGGGMGRKGIQL